MILTEVGKVRIPEPDINENEYTKSLYYAMKEMQSALERDLSNIHDEKHSEVSTE